ncbi:MAG: hypothetical protein AAFO29_20530, partial [Actinomycetota bacterium]
FWGYGAAAFWLLIGFAIPRLADLLSPTSGAIASAAVDVFFGAMIRPAVVLAIASTVVLLIGVLLPSVSGRRGARMVQPRGATAAPPPVPSPGAIAQPASRPATPGTVRPVSPPTARPAAPAPPGPAPQPVPSARAAGHPVPPSTPAAPATSAPTMQFPTQRLDQTTEMPRPVITGAERTQEWGGDVPTWEEGVGYVEDAGSDS